MSVLCPRNGNSERKLKELIDFFRHIELSILVRDAAAAGAATASGVTSSVATIAADRWIETERMDADRMMRLRHPRYSGDDEINHWPNASALPEGAVSGCRCTPRPRKKLFWA